MHSTSSEFLPKDIAIGQVTILAIFNLFLKLTNNKFRFHKNGYCNGFGALFCLYSLSGQMRNFEKNLQFISCSNIPKDQANLTAEVKCLFYKYMMNILSLQERSAETQLILESAQVITEVSFIKMKDFNNILGLSNPVFKELHNLKSQGINLPSYIIRIQMINDLYAALNKSIDISYHKTDKCYSVTLNPSGKLYIFNNLENINRWLEINVTKTFDDATEENELMVSRVESERFAISTEDKVYIINEEGVFDIDGFLTNQIENDRCILFGTDNHTMSLFKTPDGQYDWYDSSMDEIHRTDPEEIAENLPEYDDMHVSAIIYTKINQEPVKQKSLLNHSLQQLKHSWVKEYYISQDNLICDEESIDDSRDAQVDRIDSLIRHCVVNNHQEILIQHFLQLNLTSKVIEFEYWLPEVCELQQDELAQFFIDNGADVNCVNDQSQSLLHLASGNGYKATVDLLLKGRANVNITNHDGETPLILACQKGHNIVVELLLAADPNILHNDRHEKNVFIYSLELKQETILYTLLSYVIEKKFYMNLPTPLLKNIFEFAEKTNGSLFALCNKVEQLITDAARPTQEFFNKRKFKLTVNNDTQGLSVKRLKTK